ncbi:MAG: hypothetical protein FPO08_19290 [Geobacter sp.]|nr:MAG: hypothetical protein FPO08_19290 [Geobacter sp.]
MKKTSQVIAVAAFAFLVVYPPIAEAVSYPHISEEHWQLTEKGTMKSGDIVYLFYSGTPDVIKAFETNKVLVVYGKRHGKMKEVGKIKLTLSIGRYYLQGVVTEGEIRHDDIAQEGTAAGLVIFEGEILK